MIIATGATAKLLGIESEKRMMGYGVSACATCDGAFFKDKDVIVVGGGDTAMEEANFLTRFASQGHVVHRRDELRASKIMQERARKNPKIGFVWNSAIETIHGDAEGRRHRRQAEGHQHRRDLRAQDRRRLRRDRPSAQLATLQGPARDGRDRLPEDASRARPTPTSRACLPPATLQIHVYRQAVTAAGTGCMAAIDAERWLEANHPD